MLLHASTYCTSLIANANTVGYKDCKSRIMTTLLWEQRLVCLAFVYLFVEVYVAVCWLVILGAVIQP